MRTSFSAPRNTAPVNVPALVRVRFTPHLVLRTAKFVLALPTLLASLSVPAVAQLDRPASQGHEINPTASVPASTFHAPTLDAENLPELALGASSSLFAPSTSFHLASPPAAPNARLFVGPNPTPHPGNGFSARGNGAIATARIRPFTTYGASASVGINGVGFDVATPIARRFNLRAGASFFSYSDTFTEEGANVDAKLQLRSGRLLLDWFPFGNGFHVSPMVVLGNNNHARGTVIVPSGSTVTLDGSDYVSSTADPLHGSGSVDFRKTAPGLTVGFGNLVPRSGKHFSFPTEIGFYYVGQPTLKVAFTGSACDPTVPETIGCQSVDMDSDFQASLAAFKARNDHNLSYASFFPVVSTGIGFRF